MIRLTVTVLAVLAFAGCTGANQSPSAVPTIPASAPVIGVPDDVLEFVRQRAAGELGVSEEEIQFEHTEAVTWPSTAIGCPEPGRTYAQVLVPGYLVVVRGGDETLNVHISAEGQVKLCPEGQQELPS